MRDRGWHVYTFFKGFCQFVAVICWVGLVMQVGCVIWNVEVQAALYARL